MEINHPETLAAVTAEFERYEQALQTNDLATLDELFWDSPTTIRFGIRESLFGIEAIRDFRQARSSTGLTRSLNNTIITTFGEFTATANTEFIRNGQMGRQSQTWIKFPQGWRIVSAHVSHPFEAH